MSIHLKTAFKIAASLALKEAAKTAQPAILEPMMLVTITVPEENLGDVMGHVTARRGRVDGMEAHGNSQIVRAYVPLAEMFSYNNNTSFCNSRSWYIHDGII